MITNKMRLSKFNLTDEQVTILNSIEYHEGEFEYLKGQIRRYLKNNLPIEYLQKNWSEIVKLGRDSSSKRSYIIRYGEEIGLKLFQEKTKASTLTRADYIEKYGIEEAEKKLSSRGASLKNYIDRHGDQVGKEKWQEYINKRNKTFAQGRKEHRYASRNLEWFQNKYGKDKGFDVWDQKRKSQAYKVSREYYIDRYGEEEGKKRCAESKTRSQSGFIKKYGIEEGTKKYNTWLKNIVAGLKGRNNYSKWATECCEIIKETITDLYYYADKEMIWQLPKAYQQQLNQKIISPDLFYRGKIIEFHGDVFHGNPNLYESNERIHPFDKNITVGELNKIDSIRKEYYNSKGYEVLVIWENDFKQNKDEVINKCLIFLK